MTVEIRDEWPDVVLAAKLRTGKPPVPEAFPENVLRPCLLGAQLARPIQEIIRN